MPCQSVMRACSSGGHARGGHVLASLAVQGSYAQLCGVRPSHTSSQVRVAHLREGGAAPETRRLAVHSCPAHKLALEPGAPTCFYSCGEDGEVRHFDLRTRSHTKLLVCRPLDGAGRRGVSRRCAGQGDAGAAGRRLKPCQRPAACLV